MNHYQMYVNGDWREGASVNPIYDKFSGEQYAEYAVTSEAEVDEAVAAAKKSFQENKLSGSERYHILKKTAEILMKNQDEIARIITHEAGRIYGDAAWEVVRAVTSFDLAAEEARRICGEMIPTGGQAGHEDKLCFTVRQPIGVVGIVMPFNLPLVLTVNKLAPAIAAGNTIILKPTQVCPGYAVKLVEALLEAGLPKNHIQLILGRGSTTGEALLKNPDVAFYCFTGSREGGIHVRNTVGLRRCSMDLGNTTPAIIHKDVDIKSAALSCAGTGFYNAGQVCFRPQRLYVHKDIFDEFVGYAKEYAESVVVGDPMKEGTGCGPMISAEDVERVDSWVKEAAACGATIAAGGKKYSDHVYMPTVLTNVTEDMKVVKDEIFGPVIVVIPYEDFDDAIRMCNDTIYGLHAAAFTNDINLALKAADGLDYGGIIINESPATHVPNSPFGGIKDSGSGGKESPYETICEMTDVKTIVIRKA